MGLDKNIAYLQLDLLSRSGLTTALDAVINIQKHEKLATDHGMSSIFTFRNKSIALSYIALNHCVYYLYLKAVSNGSYQTTQTPKLYNFVRDTKNITQLLLRPIRSAIDLFDKDFGNNPIDSSNIKEVLADIDYIEEMIVHMLKAKIAIDLVNLYRENNVEFTDFNTNYVSASRMDDLISRSDLVTIYKSSIYDLKSKISIRAEQTNNIQPENIQATIRMFSLFVSTTSLPLRYIDYAYIDDLKIRGNKSATFNQLITDTWKIIHELK
jgi:hypothetical protein